MFTDPRAFSAALAAAGKRVPAEIVRRFQQDMLLTGLRGVVLKTPVDTGRARGNWQVTAGAPASSVVATLDKSGSATLARGTADARQVPIYGLSFISNNVPYIGVLEYGLYPRPGQNALGPHRVKSYKYVTRKGKRVRVNLTAKTRAKLSALAGPKVTSEGYSRQAPQGMVRLTFAELKARAAAIAAGISRTLQLEGGARA